MTIGLIGRKRGMTRVFTEDGVSTPVTVIEVEPNRISQLKSVDTDGYNAIQVTVGERKASRVTKPEAGHFAKAQAAAGREVCEFRVDSHDELTVGSELKVDIFEAGQKIDVSGLTKGKGFAGVVKRYGFRGGDATHGNSLSHRAPGSIGQCQTPGRVFKGKKMAGHMGDKKRTLQNLSVVRVDAERNLILVKGSVPGATGSNVVVSPAVKA
ncbi:50S ribosomal protein L3 [Methylophaga sp.]|jgi:large subunit ribosomal protein L3|uniref:50S ribosomal protein L3 n=1 Tax=Methylophaga sp. TaxID=2024840 RepID=UPI003A8FBFDB